MTLVIGVGNDYRRDDAVGLVIARALASQGKPGLRAVESHDGGLALLDLWRGADRVIIVDAISSGAAPGTLFRFDARARAVPAAVWRGSTHSYGVPQAIELARALNALPHELLVFGIEGEDFGEGVGLTSRVTKTARILANEIAEGA